MISLGGYSELTRNSVWIFRGHLLGTGLTWENSMIPEYSERTRNSLGTAKTRSVITLLGTRNTGSDLRKRRSLGTLGTRTRNAPQCRSSGGRTTPVRDVGGRPRNGSGVARTRRKQKNHGLPAETYHSPRSPLPWVGGPVGYSADVPGRGTGSTGSAQRRGARHGSRAQMPAAACDPRLRPGLPGS